MTTYTNRQTVTKRRDTTWKEPACFLFDLYCNGNFVIVAMKMFHSQRRRFWSKKWCHSFPDFFSVCVCKVVDPGNTNCNKPRLDLFQTWTVVMETAWHFISNVICKFAAYSEKKSFLHAEKARQWPAEKVSCAERSLCACCFEFQMQWVLQVRVNKEPRIPVLLRCSPHSRYKQFKSCSVHS